MGGWQGGAKFASIEESRDAAFSAIDAWVCNAPGAAYYPEYAAARRELVLDAARARARGVALQLVRRLGGRIAETWTARRLDGDRGPFADEPDAATREAIEPIIERAMSAGTAVLPSTAARIDILAPPARCAAGPLRITTIF
jgi:hypothetical protein